MRACLIILIILSGQQLPAELSEEMFGRLAYFRNTDISKDERFWALDTFLNDAQSSMVKVGKASLLPRNGCFEPPGPRKIH